jgi:hypothetical protein
MAPKSKKTPSEKKTPPKIGPITKPVVSYARILSDMKLYAKVNVGKPSKDAAHAIAAAVEYLGADLIQRAYEQSRADPESGQRVSKRHLISAIRDDEELAQIFVIPEEVLEKLRSKKVKHIVGQKKVKRHRKKKEAITPSGAPPAEAEPVKKKASAPKEGKKAKSAEVK